MNVSKRQVYMVELDEKEVGYLYDYLGGTEHGDSDVEAFGADLSNALSAARAESVE